MVIGVSYDAEVKKTKEILMNIVTSNPKVLKEPKPLVAVLELADSSVNLAVRPWCNSEDYWKVYSDITENVKLALDAGGIDSIST